MFEQTQTQKSVAKNLWETLKRSETTVHMVRETILPNGKMHLVEAHLPVGKGWMDGTGITAYINMNIGWEPAEKYFARKHQEEVEAKQAEEAAAKSVKEYNDTIAPKIAAERAERAKKEAK